MKRVLIFILGVVLTINSFATGNGQKDDFVEAQTNEMFKSSLSKQLLKAYDNYCSTQSNWYANQFETIYASCTVCTYTAAMASAMASNCAFNKAKAVSDQRFYADGTYITTQF